MYLASYACYACSEQRPTVNFMKINIVCMKHVKGFCQSSVSDPERKTTEVEACTAACVCFFKAISTADYGRQTLLQPAYGR